MRNISIPAPDGLRRLGFTVAILLCSLLLFSACNSTSTTHPDTFMVQKPEEINALLKTQGQLRLETFQQWIALMQHYSGQTDTYQQELLSDRQALATAKTESAYQQALQALRQHTAAIQMPALKNEAIYQQQQLEQGAASWGKTHTYHDSYNNTTYHMGYEYGPNGVAGWVHDELTNAKTRADYQQAIADANTFVTNFQAYRTNASDPTRWNKPHQTDLQLLRQYHALEQKVVVISLGEEAMRIYNKGHLVKAIQVTTGRPEKPSLPGFWVVESKQAPTVFKSDEPPGSAYWYPDTPINYAMLYHDGGYFVHDSWWRADYGPNTQFPHYDSSGDSFSFDGSHGCVNMSTANAAWLYNFVNLNTHVLIY